jgi:hypothetical protein
MTLTMMMMLMLQVGSRRQIQQARPHSVNDVTVMPYGGVNSIQMQQFVVFGKMKTVTMLLSYSSLMVIVGIAAVTGSFLAFFCRTHVP